MDTSYSEYYIDLMTQGIELMSKINDEFQVLLAFLIFFIVVILCYFAYKFFDMIFKF